MERILTAGLLFACVGYSVAAAIEYIYFLEGKSVTLKPPSGSATPMTSVTWRHYEDLAAEWSQGDPTFESYRNFKGRTILNTANGYLEINNMTEQEAGTYSVEINNLRLEDRYVVTKVEKPPVPNVWIKPAGEQADQREAVCQGNEGKAGPVTYWWDVAEDGSWVRLDERILVQNNETTRRKETFSCKIVSPVAEEQSQPEPNPFYPKATGNSALGALAIIPILILIGVGVGIWKKDEIKKFFSAEATVDAARGTNGGTSPVPPDPERVSLKSTEAAGNQS